jgi:hypothetical protein
MGVHENLTGAERAARYRAAKRAQGLRLKQIWVPDLRDPKVREKIRKEGAEINRRDSESGVMAWLESVQEGIWDDEPDYDWGPGGPPAGA